MNFGDKTIYCNRCKQERWVGADCPASETQEKCDDTKKVKIKRQRKRISEA